MRRDDWESYWARPSGPLSPHKAWIIIENKRIFALTYEDSVESSSGPSHHGIVDFWSGIGERDGINNLLGVSRYLRVGLYLVEQSWQRKQRYDSLARCLRYGTGTQLLLLWLFCYYCSTESVIKSKYSTVVAPVHKWLDWCFSFSVFEEGGRISWASADRVCTVQWPGKSYQMVWFGMTGLVTRLNSLH
jgi:hypothetical protein